MIGKVAFSSICAGFAFLVAVRSHHQTVQMSASVLGAGLLSYTTTACILDSQRRQKRRLADAEAYLEFLQQMNQERSGSAMPAACQGCQHYHGQKYGGNLLICGMHPYGVEDDHCPDWQE